MIIRLKIDSEPNEPSSHLKRSLLSLLVQLKFRISMNGGPETWTSLTAVLDETQIDYEKLVDSVFKKYSSND